MQEDRVYLVTTDLHLTAKEQDAYRFEIFPWLTRACLKHGVTDLCILGDLTDAKDRHSAALVKIIVDSLHEVLEHTDVDIHILKGNHDYLVDESSPFFGFLNRMDRIEFYVFPTIRQGCLFLPNSKQPEKDWARLNFNDYDYIFMHQGFSGALTSSGFELEEGADQSVLKGSTDETLVFSGDIHVPQKIGRVTYVGTPYPVSFADSFDCRVLLLSKRGVEELQFNTINKHTIDVSGLEDMEGLDIKPGDHVKLRVHVKENELDKRVTKRTELTSKLKEMGVVVQAVNTVVDRDEEDKPEEEEQSILKRGMSPEEIIQNYGETEKLDKTSIQIGQALSKQEEV